MTTGLVEPDKSEADRPGAGKADQKNPTNWWEELRGLAFALLAVFAFQCGVAKQFYIPSISMMPNLLVGDRLVVTKYPYGYNWSSVIFHLLPRGTWRVMGATPQYGDIVVIVPPNRKDDLIKRVVALPGDRVAVVNGQIILNGKPVPQAVEPPVDIPADDKLTCENTLGRGSCYEAFQPYRTRLPDGRDVYELPALRETLPNGATYTVIKHIPQAPFDQMPEITVPAGHLFLMGDNRDHSADSRVPAWASGLGGPVPLSDVSGRAEFVTFSWNGSETWNPLTWWGALRQSRAWHSLRPEHAAPAGNPADATR
jgi:signal peptidase I